MADTQHSSETSGVQPGLLETSIQFIQDSWGELHRVQWPNQETIIKHTSVVVVLVIFMALYIGGLDYILSKLFHLWFNTAA